MKANRQAFGEALVELYKSKPNIVSLDADLAAATYSAVFKKEHPEAFIDCGIAEQNMMTVAAGLSTVGLIPFVSTFAVFASLRAGEQFRNSICYPHLNVKVVGTHAGIECGADGATHQALEDIALMRTIPGTVVLAPADAYATRALVFAMADHVGPCYMRVGRDKVEEIYDAGTKFTIGGSHCLRKGNKAAILAAGDRMQSALEAADILEKEGIVKIVISDISGYTYSEYNLGSLNANGYKALYSKTFGIPVHVDASSTIWAEGARLLGEHPEMLRNSVKLEMTIRDKYGSLIFDKTVPDGNLLETDFVAKSTNRYTVELRYFLNEELIGFHSETLIPILGDNNYNYTITLDDLSENAYQLAKEAYQSVDAERVAREQEKVEQERKLLEKEQRRIEEEERQKRKEAATALLEGRNDMPSVNTVEEKKKLEFSLGMNIGYYGSVFNSSFLRTGVDIQLTWPVDMFVLGLRFDCSAYTYGLGRNYPGFDISASFVLGMDIADFGTGKVFLETAYGLGYLNSMEGYSGDPFDTVTFRVLMGLGVRFGGFKVTTDILFDTGIYSYYDSYFEFSTTGIELAFTPMISIGYSF